MTPRRAPLALSPAAALPCAFGKAARDTTVGLDSGSTHDWPADQWTAPFNPSERQLVRIGRQAVSFALAAPGDAAAPEGPDCGVSLATTFPFPQ